MSEEVVINPFSEKTRVSEDSFNDTDWLQGSMHERYIMKWRLN